MSWLMVLVRAIVMVRVTVGVSVIVRVMIYTCSGQGKFVSC